MIHKHSATNSARHIYFNRLPRLWNSLPPFDLDISINKIKSHLRDYLYTHFLANFNSTCSCSFHFLCPCSKCIQTSHPPWLRLLCSPSVFMATIYLTLFFPSLVLPQKKNLPAETVELRRRRLGNVLRRQRAVCH